MKELVYEFWQEEDGMQTVEMVLILIVMVGLVGLLSTAARGWVNSALDQASTLISDLSAGTPTPIP